MRARNNTHRIPCRHCFLPRTGYHLMKCISQNLWGRAKAAVHIIKSAAVLPALNSPHCILRPQEAKTHTLSEHNLPNREPASSVTAHDRSSIKTVTEKDCTHLYEFSQLVTRKASFSKKKLLMSPNIISFRDKPEDRQINLLHINIHL